MSSLRPYSLDVLLIQSYFYLDNSCFKPVVLGVSCGIIFRSFVLRRRFRQRVEEAIAAGVLLPDGRLAPAAGGSRRGNVFGAKPVLWEVWMERPEEKVEEWDNIQVSNVVCFGVTGYSYGFWWD